MAIGKFASAVGLAAWGIFIVGLVDNLLRPQLLKRSVRVHPLLILLSVLGGIQFFGPAGFLLGPVALSLFVALLDIYPRVLLGRDGHAE
jgi:predicted PurR-regulated permease PerM